MKKRFGSSTQDLRVLVVDDDENLRHTLQHWLLEERFDARVARDGEEAWALLSTSDPSPLILITDNQMPGITGIELLSRARKESIPILGAILMSGDSAIKTQGESVSADFAHHHVPFFILLKPFMHEDLSACLSEMRARQIREGR